MSDVNQVIDFFMGELRADALRKDDDPFKLSKYQRDEMFKRILTLQMSKGRVKKSVVIQSNGLTAKNNVKLGRPRKDLNPETGSKSFLRELKAKLKDKELVNGEKVDSIGDQEAGADYEAGQEQRDLEVGSRE